MTLIAVAGGGIAGLATALALAGTGVTVTVLEAAATLSEAGAGIQLSPNATRILRRLGLLERVAARSVRPERVRIRRGRDGADLAAIPLGASAEARYGAPFLVVHRADLQAVLLDAVRAEPRITLVTGAPVTAVVADPAGVAVTAGGASLRMHGLVGADGLHSRVRRLLAPEGDPLRFSGRTAWRSLVPAAHAPIQARLPASTLWLGTGAHLVHYPVRDGTLINVVAILQDRWSRIPEADDWAIPGEPDRLLHAFASWAEEARALLRAAPGWRVWPLMERQPLACWSRGRVTLVGDAAHPMLPFLAQGAAQAIEDAGALAVAVAAAPDFAAAAAAYDRARRPKATRVQTQSTRQGAVYHLGRPAALARDAVFRMLGPARLRARYDWLYGP